MDEHEQELGSSEPTITGRTCQICDCTDDKACEGGCGWVIMFGKQIEICTKCITDRIPECLDLLVETIEGLHRDNNIDEGTSTVDLCAFARKIEKVLRQ